MLIVDKLIKELGEQLKDKDVTVEVTDEARAWIADKGFDPMFGARPMDRFIQNEIKKPLADRLLFGDLKNGGHLLIGLKDDKLDVSHK